MSYERVLDIFYEITTIPRPSWHEEQIRDRLIKRAENNAYSFVQDSVWNLVITVPAKKWHRHRPTCILQAHMDMVCVKTPQSTHDFFNDTLQLQEIDGWLSAVDTTLWADNGMWVAMILAMVEHGEHWPLELFFTVDEERGLVWALQFDPEYLSGRYLINLDTEDEWEICISSAWWGRLVATKDVSSLPNDLPCYTLILDWLPWGHSGTYINAWRWNAIRALAQFLLSEKDTLQLISFHWGQADNAIPWSATATIATSNIQEIEQALQSFIISYQSDIGLAWITYTITQTATEEISVWNRDSILTSLLNQPNGVQKLSKVLDWLVQTSLSVWVATFDKTWVSITHAMRSAVYQELLDLLDHVKISYEADGFEVTIKNVYPGWQEKPNWKLIKLAKAEYQKVLWRTINVVAYHAWLECWAIVERLTQEVSAISFWPTIKDPHSPNERIYLPSVESTYTTLCNILKKI